MAEVGRVIQTAVPSESTCTDGLSERPRVQCAGVAHRCVFSPAVRGQPVGGVLDGLVSISPLGTPIQHAKAGRHSTETGDLRPRHSGLPGSCAAD
jgi:hypothetical protein